jgi:predicted transcriptional regulator
MAEDEVSESVAVRVPKDLLERVRDVATAEDRTIGRQIVRLIRLGIAIEEAERAARVTT